MGLIFIATILHCICMTNAVPVESKTSEGCNCTHVSHDVIVNCSSRSLTNPPASLPSDLTKLLLYNNSIADIDRRYFEAFPLITYLDLSYNNRLGLDNVSKAFYGLRNSKISVINISSIVQEYYNPECSKLKSEFFHHLRNTPLKEIYLDSNWIHLIEHHSLRGAPKSLEILSMRKSRLVLTFWFIMEFSSLENLVIFTLTERNVEERLKKDNLETQIIKDRRSVVFPQSVSIALPPKLEDLNFNVCGFRSIIPQLTFTNNSLKRVNLGANRLCPIEGPLTGLDELEELDLSDNSCGIFPKDWSLKFPAPKLKNLTVKSNYLDLSDKKNIFDHWQNLRILDVSYNKISIIPHTVFDKLILLEKLSLKGNIIYDFSVNLILLIKLLLLDLSENQISFLSEIVTRQLDSLRTVSNLSLDINGNPIRCSCDVAKLKFIRWLIQTNVTIVAKSNLTCTTDNSEEGKKLIERFIPELERQCESPTRYYGLAMGTAVTVTGCVCFILMSIVYRYRYKLAYIYFIGRRRYRSTKNDEEYNFDAYIAYADEDRHFALHQFRKHLVTDDLSSLCYRDINFLPGEVTASQIVTCIGRSRLVVLVLSPAFLKSFWGPYEFAMAQFEGIERREPMVFFAKYGDITLSDLPKNMLRMLDSQTYLEFPETKDDEEIFWKRLRYTITGKEFPAERERLTSANNDTTDTTDTTLDTEHTDSGCSDYCPMLHTSDQLGLPSNPSVFRVHDTTAAANNGLGRDS